MWNDGRKEHEHTEPAARGTASVGGVPAAADESDEARDGSMRPVAETGGGEAGREREDGEPPSEQ
jgi:hypothetical protein